MFGKFHVYPVDGKRGTLLISCSFNEQRTGPSEGRSVCAAALSSLSSSEEEAARCTSPLVNCHDQPCLLVPSLMSRVTTGINDAQFFVQMCIVHTTQDVSAQGLKRTTPRTHSVQVKVQKKKSTTLNFGDLVDHPPLHPGYLHKMFYPLTASFSLSPSSCPPGSARSIPSLTSYGPETCQSVSSDGIAPKLASPPRRPIFSPTLAFPIGSLFGHFLANSFPTTSFSSFLSSDHLVHYLNNV